MKIVRLIFERYEAAGSFHAVQVYLHERQLMAQNASRTTDFFIRNLLSNPVYCVADEAARSYFEERGSKVAGEAALWDGRHGIMPYNRHSKKRKGLFSAKSKNGFWLSESMRERSKENGLFGFSGGSPPIKNGITVSPAPPTITRCCPGCCTAPNAGSGCTPNRKTKKAEVPAQTAGSTSASPRRNIPAKPARAKRCWAAELMKRC